MAYFVAQGLLSDPTILELQILTTPTFQLLNARVEIHNRAMRKLILSNYSYIMSSSNSRSSPNPNHRLLEDLIKEIASSLQDAKEKFADVISAMAADGEMRDFDMGVFFNHFGLDSLQKCILAVSLKTNPRTDLRNKGLSYRSLFLQNGTANRYFPKPTR